ncbi:MAG TPA: hypothetical protein DEF04_10690 [Clostridiales bacterium]|nr:hypothetical protein [Clostridiales bacterium]
MKIDDSFIFEYIFDTVKSCEHLFEEVIAVAKDDDVLRKASSLGFKDIRNVNSYLGQSSTIKLGVQNSATVDGFMFFVADQPFISKNTIKSMLGIFDQKPDNIIVSCCNGINRNPVIFPIEFKSDLLKLEGDMGGRIILKSNTYKIIKVHVQSEHEFKDIDTMQDYEEAIGKKG